MKQRLRRYCFTVVFCGVAAWLLTTTAHADALITVTTTSDVIADDNLCSLREAIIAANTDSVFHDCPGGSSADTISFASTLPKPTIFTLTQSGREENNGHCGDLDISGALTISGTNTPGADSIIIDGNNTDRVFEILQGAKVAMMGVTIQHGNPGAMADGGGVLIDLTARLTLTDSQIISNSALSGGGIKVLGGLTMRDSRLAGNRGGALYNNGGLMMLNNIQVTHNSGGYAIRNLAQGSLSFNTGWIDANQGGGIANATATATLNNLKIVNNTDGSGIANTGATLSHLTVSHSIVMSNTATSGGGIFNEGVGAITNLNTTRVSNNTAASNGGGLYNNGVMAVSTSTIDHNHARAGAGLHHFGGNLSLTNTTISHNDATDNGGGLYNGGSAVLMFVTFNANQAGGEGGNLFNDEAQMSIESSILAQAQTGSNCFNSNGFLSSLGYNLESANTCNFTAAGDLINTDPLLGPLQDNGALNNDTAFTHALLPGSLAIDHGAATCPATDQRGVARPQGTACDSGAYEFAQIADLAIEASVAPSTVTVGSRMTYTLNIRNLGLGPATALTLTAELPNSITFITATIVGGDCVLASRVACTLPTLAAGMAATAAIAVTVPVTVGVITNTAVITAATPDLNGDNNRVTTVITVTLPGADLIPPGPVGNLSATAITTQGATLMWTPATDNVAVAGYRILAQKDGSSPPPFLVDLVDASATTYTVTTLAPDTGYQLWVIAFDLAGNETLMTDSVPVSITTLSPLVGTVAISIEPPLPSTQDAISITISGRHTSSCTPQYQAHQRTGNLILIQSVPSPEPFCLPAEFPWNYTIGLGRLEVGHYTVTHTLEVQVDTAVFTVTSRVPDAPVIEVDERQMHTATVGELFQFVVKATGTPAPTYTLSQAPPGMTLDAVSGQLSWTPSAAGAITVIVQATNHRGRATYTLQLIAQLPANGSYRSFLPLVGNG